MRSLLTPGCSALLLLSSWLCACMETAEEGAPNGRVWRELTPLPGGPRQELGVTVIDERVYAVGGLDAAGNAVATLERFDVRTGVWETRASLPERLHHPNVAAVDGQLYLLGALDASFAPSGSMYRYDPSGDTWTRLGTMPPGTERGASAVGVRGTRIVIAGGDRGGSVGDASEFDTATSTWTTLPPLVEPRDHLVGGVLDGVFYAAGGRRNGSLRGNVDALSENAAGWLARAPLPTPRAGCAGAVLEGRLYVIGGEGNAEEANGLFSETESYDPVTDSWREEATMRTPRHGMGAAVADGQLIVPGGATQEGVGAVATNEALSASAP